jgi:tRNA threonylcarbamoyladenosine modification (KEOPS) complex  Pcc1 subunit
LEAELSLEYPTPEFAQSIMKALEPDNTLTTREMRISTSVHGKRLNVRIDGCKRIETLEATVQDVFRCIRAAEESLSKATSNH